MKKASFAISFYSAAWRHLYTRRQTFILISCQTTPNLKTQMIRVIRKCILEWLINKKIKMCILLSFSLSISLTHSNGDYVYITYIMYICLSLVYYLNPQVCFLITLILQSLMLLAIWQIPKIMFALKSNLLPLLLMLFAKLC